MALGPAKDLAMPRDLHSVVDTGCSPVEAAIRQVRHGGASPDEHVLSRVRVVHRTHEPDGSPPVIDPVAIGFAAAQVPEILVHAVFPEERPHGIVRTSVATPPDDLPEVVDGSCAGATDPLHDAVPPEEGALVARVLLFAHAHADDLPSVVDVGSIAELPARESAKVGHDASIPKEGAVPPPVVRRPTEDHAPADDLPSIVDCGGMTLALADAEVRHRAVLPEEGAGHVGRVDTRSDHLTRVVDVGGGGAAVSAGRTSHGSEVRHRAVIPEGQALRRVVPTLPDYLTVIVDRRSLTPCVAGERPEIEDGSRPGGRGRPQHRVIPAVGRHLTRPPSVACVVGPVRGALVVPQGSEIDHCPALPEERMAVAGGGAAGADGLAPVIDVVGLRIRNARFEVSEIPEGAALPEVGRRHPSRFTGDGDLSKVVDASREPEEAGRMPEIRPHAVRPPGPLALVVTVGEDAGDLAGVVDRPSRAGRAAPGRISEIRHRALVPKEGVPFTGRRQAFARDLPCLVDPVPGARRPTQRPEVRHDAVLPEEGAPGGARCRPTRTDDLARAVDAFGRAGGVAG